MTIAVEDRIGIPAIAKLFGVHSNTFYMARPYLEQFPAAEYIGKKKFYSLAAVNAWAEGKDAKALILAGFNRYRAGEIAAETAEAQLMNLSRRFHAGEFDHPEIVAIHDKNRATARANKPQTTRVCIRPE